MKLLKFLSIPLLYFLIAHLCHLKTAGFQLSKIHSFLPYNPAWEIPGQETPPDALLQSPFHFLGKGGQGYAFVSEDGAVVLKLFKMHNLRQYPWAYTVSLPPALDQLRLKLLLEQRKKLERTFTSSLIAYTQLQEETALLYLNLNPNPNLANTYVTLVDKLGIPHRLCLKDIPFAIQRKGESAASRLKRLLKKNDLISAKLLIHQMIECLNHRKIKGVIDYDPSPKRNMGFTQDRAFFIDIGNFAASEEKENSDIESLRRWLSRKSAELTSYLDEITKDSREKM